jgi:GNAT superfamily N-acetyltransferase
MLMVTVHLAAPGEAAALGAIAREAYHRYVPRIGREPAPMSADYAAAVGDGQAWVAAGQGQVIGFVVLIAQLDHLLVRDLAVRPPWQGRGVGSRLLALAEDVAGRLRLAEIRLYTNEAMTENLAITRGAGMPRRTVQSKAASAGCSSASAWPDRRSGMIIR